MANKVLNDRYELLRNIGGGGFGVVWLARDCESGAFAAVKQVSNVSKGSHEVRAVGLFAQKLKKLSPPSVISIDSFGIEGGSLFYAMPLCDGIDAAVSPEDENWRPKTLADVIEARSRSERWFDRGEVGDIFLPIARAVDALGRAGVLHRDIKPSNIFFLRGEPVLGDVGLLAEDSISVSSAGTPQYTIPPSWYRKSGGNPDLWGLAALLYALITSYSPDTIGRAAYRYPPQGKDAMYTPDIVAWDIFHRIINRATAERATERYLRVSDMAAAVERAARGEIALGVSASEPPPARESAAFDPKMFLPDSSSVKKILLACSMLAVAVFSFFAGNLIFRLRPLPPEEPVLPAAGTKPAAKSAKPASPSASQSGSTASSAPAKSAESSAKLAKPSAKPVSPADTAEVIPMPAEVESSAAKESESPAIPPVRETTTPTPAQTTAASATAQPPAAPEKPTASAPEPSAEIPTVSQPPVVDSPFGRPASPEAAQTPTEKPAAPEPSAEIPTVSQPPVVDSPFERPASPEAAQTPTEKPAAPELSPRKVGGGAFGEPEEPKETEIYPDKMPAVRVNKKTLKLMSEYLRPKYRCYGYSESGDLWDDFEQWQEDGQPFAVYRKYDNEKRYHAAFNVYKRVFEDIAKRGWAPRSIAPQTPAERRLAAYVAALDPDTAKTDDLDDILRADEPLLEAYMQRTSLKFLYNPRDIIGNVSPIRHRRNFMYIYKKNADVYKACAEYFKVYIALLQRAFFVDPSLPRVDRAKKILFLTDIFKSGNYFAVIDIQYGFELLGNDDDIKWFNAVADFYLKKIGRLKFYKFINRLADNPQKIADGEVLSATYTGYGTVSQKLVGVEHLWDFARYVPISKLEKYVLATKAREKKLPEESAEAALARGVRFQGGRDTWSSELWNIE